MQLIDKLLTGDNNRPTRFHDEEGNLVDFVGFCYTPRAFLETVARILFNYRPLSPWLSFRAINKLKNLVKSDWSVLEFGSGMSTVWWAQNVSFVHSIEDDQEWYELVKVMLSKQNLTNVEYEYREYNTKNLWNYAQITNDRYYDFILVDGRAREYCMEMALQKVKPNGWIYLDNSDRAIKAKNLLLEAVKSRQGNVEYFIDFTPATFVVTQGILAHFPDNNL